MPLPAQNVDEPFLVTKGGGHAQERWCKDWLQTAQPLKGLCSPMPLLQLPRLLCLGALVSALIGPYVQPHTHHAPNFSCQLLTSYKPAVFKCLLALSQGHLVLLLTNFEAICPHRFHHLAICHLGLLLLYLPNCFFFFPKLV